jgi:hypothetical protein
LALLDTPIQVLHASEIDIFISLAVLLLWLS